MTSFQVMTQGELLAHIAERWNALQRLLERLTLAQSTRPRGRSGAAGVGSIFF